MMRGWGLTETNATCWCPLPFHPAISSIPEERNWLTWLA